MGRVEPMVRVSGVWGRVCFSVSCGFDSGRLFLAPRLNRLGEGKLVEPACERQRVGRVETLVTLSGVLGLGSGCPVRGSCSGVLPDLR